MAECFQTTSKIIFVLCGEQAGVDLEQVWDFMREDFSVFRDLLQRFPWEMVSGSFVGKDFGILVQAALGDSDAAVSRGSEQMISRGAVQPQQFCALVLACIKNRLKEYWRMSYPGLFLEPRKS